MKRNKAGVTLATMSFAIAAHAQVMPPGPPELLDPNLALRTVVTGLSQPISMVFIGDDDFLLIEKASGQVKRVTGGVVTGVVLDLAVNSNSERGGLGLALHPNFPATPYVYIYWTESTLTDAGGNRIDSTAANDVPQTPPMRGLGNRVDRFTWDGTSLDPASRFPVIAFRSETGNHNGGVIDFGPDGKLYVIVGDNGRRGWMQNLPCGPADTCADPSFPNPGPVVPDDLLGGPQPDNHHFTGIVARLNDDGTAPADNPFYNVGRNFAADLLPEAAANIQKLFMYGVRNSFGMDFDPVTGDLWVEQNGDDSFSELNRAVQGSNSAWVQLQGPLNRLAEYKGIETNVLYGTFCNPPLNPDPRSGGYFGLQQARWLPTNIADTEDEVLARLMMLPGARVRDPELSWRLEVAPAGIGFLNGTGLGAEYENDLFMGSARSFPENHFGHIYHFELSQPKRAKIDVSDPRLNDRVADNCGKWNQTESESLLIGKNFTIVTDLESSPRGTMYVVANMLGAVYEIYRP